jgi:hypothetical protein
LITGTPDAQGSSITGFRSKRVIGTPCVSDIGKIIFMCSNCKEPIEADQEEEGHLLSCPDGDCKLNSIVRASVHHVAMFSCVVATRGNFTCSYQGSLTAFIFSPYYFYRKKFNCRLLIQNRFLELTKRLAQIPHLKKRLLGIPMIWKG